MAAGSYKIERVTVRKVRGLVLASATVIQWLSGFFFEPQFYYLQNGNKNST
jgi:hypothetical protein